MRWRWPYRLAIKFDRMMSLKFETFDQYIDYVRSIEPPEEPERNEAEEFWSDGSTVYDSLTTKSLDLQDSVSK